MKLQTRTVDPVEDCLAQAAEIEAEALSMPARFTRKRRERMAEAEKMFDTALAVEAQGSQA